MEEIKKAPAPLREETETTQYKYSESLPRIQRLVYNLLLTGDKFSVADISVHLHLSDPRSHIKQLRDKGITILDEWRTSIHQNKYKVYWMGKEVSNE